jgi:hypothetical protein
MDRSYSLSEFARQNDIGLTTVRGQSRPSRGAQSWPANNYRGRGRQGLAGTVAKSAAAISRLRWGAVMGMFGDLIPNAAMAGNLS